MSFTDLVSEGGGRGGEGGGGLWLHKITYEEQVPGALLFYNYGTAELCTTTIPVN